MPYNTFQHHKQTTTLDFDSKERQRCNVQRARNFDWTPVQVAQLDTDCYSYGA